MVAPTTAVLPEGSKGGDTSTTSPPTRSSPLQAAQHLLRLGRRIAADLRRAGAGRVDRVQPVHVEADIGRSRADHAPCLLDHLLDAELEELLDIHDADALSLAPVIVGLAVERAANTDLDGALGIEQAFLDRAAERRAVGQFVVAEIAVPGIGMGVEMHHADRPVLGDGAHDRQRDQVVAARREGNAARLVQFGEKLLDPLDGVVEVDRIDRAVAHVAAARQVVGADPADMVNIAHQAGGVAQGPGPVPRPGPVRGPPVPGHAAEGDIQPLGVLEHRQAHEGGDPAEARHDQAAEGFGIRRVFRHDCAPALLL